MMTQRSHTLVCLGTGHGSSAVYGGGASASYVLCADREPVLLMGAGYGVVQSCLRMFGKIPKDVFVWSNRSHFAAELPVLLAVEAHHREKPLRLLGSHRVLSRIEVHRLAELQELVDAEDRNLDTLVELAPVLPVVYRDGTTAEESHHVDGVVLQDDPGISVRCFLTRTTEASAGIAIYSSHSGGRPLFAVTGDGSLDEPTLRGLMQRFQVVVTNGRDRSSRDHCAVADLVPIAESERTKRASSAENGAVQPRYFVGHYGPVDACPAKLLTSSTTGSPALQPIVEGMLVTVQYKVSLKAVTDGNGSLSVVEGITVNSVANAVSSGAQQQGPAAASKPHELISSGPFAEGSPRVPLNSATRASGVRGQRDPSPTVAAGAINRTSRDPSPRAPIPFLPTAVGTSATPGLSLSGHVAAAKRSSSASTPQNPLPKRIYVFSNEEKAAAGKMIMVQAFRNVQQVKMRVAELTGIRPLGELHVMPEGAVVTSLQQLTYGCCVVATKIGGERFSLSSLPHALQKGQSAVRGASANHQNAAESTAVGAPSAAPHPSPKETVAPRLSLSATQSIPSIPDDVVAGPVPMSASVYAMQPLLRESSSVNAGIKTFVDKHQAQRHPSPFRDPHTLDAQMEDVAVPQQHRRAAGRRTFSMIAAL